MVELDRDGTPEGFHDRVDIRLREHLREDRSEGLRERAAAFREDQQAFRRRRAISFDGPPAEPMQDRPMGRFGSDVIQRASPRDRLGLLEECVVLAELPERAEQRAHFSSGAGVSWFTIRRVTRMPLARSAATPSRAVAARQWRRSAHLCRNAARYSQSLAGAARW